MSSTNDESPPARTAVIAADDILPVTAGQRYAGTGLMFWLWCGGNILLTTFLVGGYYATALGAAGMVVVTIVGAIFGNVLPALSGLRSTRYGVDEYVGLRATFGVRGSHVGVALLVLINFGWVGILAAIAGHSGEASMAALGLHWGGWFSLFALACGIAVPVLMIWISPKTVFTLVKFAVPLLIIFAALVLYRQLATFGWAAIERKPADQSVNWAYALEANIAYAVAWFPYMGAWNRFARTERASFWGTWGGLVVIATLFGVVGGIATITTGSSDPSVWATRSGLGVPALGIIILSTIINSAMFLYCSVIALRTAAPRLGYHWIAILVALPPILFIYQGSLATSFSDILTIGGAFIAPYWGVALGDYFFVRRQRLDLVALYQPRGAYWYTSGYNLAALGVWAGGVVAWMFLGGWLSPYSVLRIAPGESAFAYLTATAPVVVGTALAYAAIATAIERRRTVLRPSMGNGASHA
jgi:NCS1 family nucleobase:cation symporter-1